ncbi:hypothetical protein KM043_018520 [Ampulex compressa]|nr:hypothetical protein KM043_018520 [Ampulex compressa]
MRQWCRNTNDGFLLESLLHQHARIDSILFPLVRRKVSSSDPELPHCATKFSYAVVRCSPLYIPSKFNPNNRTKLNIQCSSDKLAFNRKLRRPSSLPYKKSLPHKDLLKKWTQTHDAIFSEARERLELRQEHTSKRLNEKKNKTDFDNITKGQEVYLHNESKKHKSDLKWLGPYEVIELYKNKSNVKMTKMIKRIIKRPSIQLLQ